MLKVCLSHCVLHVIIELRGSPYFLHDLTQCSEVLGQVHVDPLFISPYSLDVLLLPHLFHDHIEHLLLELMLQHPALDLSLDVLLNATAFL